MGHAKRSLNCVGYLEGGFLWERQLPTLVCFILEHRNQLCFTILGRLVVAFIDCVVDIGDSSVVGDGIQRELRTRSQMGSETWP